MDKDIEILTSEFAMLCVIVCIVKNGRHKNIDWL